MKKDYVVLKYDRNTSLKTGALSYKLYVFLLSITALLVLISSAVFDVACNLSGFSDVVVSKYVFKLIYVSLFILVVWLLNIPVWLPGYFAETSVYIKKGGILYKGKYKKDNTDEKPISDEELIYLVENNKNGEEFSKIKKYEDVEVLKKKKKYAVLKGKYNKNGKMKTKKIKIYNIYENFLEL